MSQDSNPYAIFWASFCKFKSRQKSDNERWIPSSFFVSVFIFQIQKKKESSAPKWCRHAARYICCWWFYQVFENNILTERCRKVIRLDELTEAPRAPRGNYYFCYLRVSAKRERERDRRTENITTAMHVLVEIMMQCAHGRIDQTRKCCLRKKKVGSINRKHPIT